MIPANMVARTYRCPGCSRPVDVPRAPCSECSAIRNLEDKGALIRKFTARAEAKALAGDFEEAGNCYALVVHIARHGLDVCREQTP